VGVGGGSARRSGKDLAPIAREASTEAAQAVAYHPREVAEMVGMSESGIRNPVRRATLHAVPLRAVQMRHWLIPATSSRTSSASNSTRAPHPDAAQTPA
jgi:hypothetical protein